MTCPSHSPGRLHSANMSSSSTIGPTGASASISTTPGIGRPARTRSKAKPGTVLASWVRSTRSSFAANSSTSGSSAPPIADTGLLDGDQIDVRPSAAEGADDVAVEILVGQKGQHGEDRSGLGRTPGEQALTNLLPVVPGLRLAADGRRLRAPPVQVGVHVRG